MNKMNGYIKGPNNSVVTIVIIAIIVAILGFGGWFLSEQNRKNEEDKKDPEKILGYTIGEINRRYCSEADTRSKFYISNRTFDCSDLDNDFISSDLDNYVLSSYSFSIYSASFYFDIDETQNDLRPLKVDNPEQFVGQMVTALCPRYSLADFKVFAAGENIGTSVISCRDIYQYSMDQKVVITTVYYGPDTKNGDDPREYYEQNNAQGTRKLYFDGEYIEDRISN